MAEAEEFAELNRLLSGELSGEESLALMRRMLRDADLREAYERLLAVDAAAREATFSDEVVEGAEALEGNGLRAERRQERIGAILAKTSSDAAPPGRRGRPWLRPGFFRRRAPSVIAAAALFILGLLLALWEPWQAMMYRGPTRIGQERIARLREIRQGLGNVVVRLQGTGDGVESWQSVEADGQGNVILRVTVIRDDNPEAYVCDALVPQGHLVELVMAGREGWQPDSVKVCVAGDYDYRIPVAIQARLTSGAEIAQTVKVAPEGPERIAELRAGGVRWQIFVEARPEQPAAPPI